MLYLWEMISKIEFNSVEFNCSIFLSLLLFDCVEEDWSLSSRDRTQREFVLMAQYQPHLLSCIGMIAVVSTGSLCCGFAFAINLAATIVILVLWHLVFLWICRNFCICFDLNRPRIWSFHKIFWPKIENCLDPQTRFEFQFHIWSF